VEAAGSHLGKLKLVYNILDTPVKALERRS